MIYCTEFVILQSALQLVDKVKQNGQNIQSNEDRANSSVNVLKLAVQEIVQGVEEDNEPEEQLAWSKKIHCTVLYKVLTLHYGESLEKFSVEIIDDFSDGPIEPQKIDSRDALSSILPPVSLSLYFNIVQQCDWFHFFTETLSHLREDLARRLIKDGLKYLQQQENYKTCDLKLGFCFLEYLVTYLTSGVNTDNANEALTLLPDVVVQCCKVVDSLDENSMQSEDINDLATGFHQTSLLLCLCNGANSTENLQNWFLGNTIANRRSDSESENNFNFRDHLGNFTRDSTTECFLQLNRETVAYLREILPLETLLTFLIKLMSVGGQALSCSLLGSITSEAEQRFIRVCETTILMHPDNLNSKPTPTPSKVSVMVDSKNLCRQVIELLSEACKNSDVRDTCETIHNYLSSLLKSVTFNNDIFPDICITAAIWRIQERQTAFKDILLRFVKSPVASLWSCDKLLSVLQSQPEILAEEEIMLHLYDLVWKLNGTLAKAHLNKLIKLVLDSFGHLDFSSCGKHVLHVYRTYKQWPKPNPIASQSLNQTLNKITAGIAGKVLLEVLQAALQDADLIMVQLLERAAGSTQQADIVCSIFQTLRELCVCPDDSGRSKLCSKIDLFLTTHSLNQKEQDIVIKFLQSLIKSSPEADPVLNAEEFYLSVIVPHLSLHRPSNSVLGVRLALDLGTMLLGEILNQWKSNLDLTLSLVLAAEVLDNCSVLWCGDTEKVTLKQRLVAFLNQLRQFQKLDTTFCVNWIVKVTMDYDCTVRMAILQVCLTEEEFHDVCDILCRDLFLPDKDLDYVNILRLAAVSDTLSDRIGSYCQQKLNYNILILTLLQVGPHLITEEWNRMFKFLRNLISLRHLNVSVKMHGILPLVNLEGLSTSLPLSQLLSDFLKLQRYVYSDDQRSPAATEYCIRSAMAVFKNVVMEDITSIPPQCCLFLLTQSFSHIIMATGENPTEMLDSVNILLLDIVCQIEELSKGNCGTAFKDQMSGILHTSHSIRNAETKEMVRKKIFSFLQ